MFSTLIPRVTSPQARTSESRLLMFFFFSEQISNYGLSPAGQWFPHSFIYFWILFLFLAMCTGYRCFPIATNSLDSARLPSPDCGGAPPTDFCDPRCPPPFSDLTFFLRRQHISPPSCRRRCRFSLVVFGVIADELPIRFLTIEKRAPPSLSPFASGFFSCKESKMLINRGDDSCYPLQSA